MNTYIQASTAAHMGRNNMASTKQTLAAAHWLAQMPWPRNCLRQTCHQHSLAKTVSSGLCNSSAALQHPLDQLLLFKTVTAIHPMFLQQPFQLLYPHTHQLAITGLNRLRPGCTCCSCCCLLLPRGAVIPSACTAGVCTAAGGGAVCSAC